MAYTIPNYIPSKASQGEKTLFGRLRDGLPDDFIVWYEPVIDNKHPDFIILGPTFGLLIIEVKGWFGNQIERADRNTFDIRRTYNGNVKVETENTPLRQARNYLYTIIDRLKEHSILCHPEGLHRGKLVFPTGVGAVMSNMTESQAQQIGVDRILEVPDVAYRNELLEWQSLSDRQLIQRLRSMLSVKFNFFGLTDDQISTIKGVLHPEVWIRQEPATPKSFPAEIKSAPLSTSKIIISLDPEQETLARRLGDGHRLFSGVAGSGKTLILIARAKFLANKYPNYKILILCYNKSLAAYLRSLIYSEEYPAYKEQIQVLHFHAWAKSILGKVPVSGDYSNEQDWHQCIGEKLCDNLSKSSKKWDAILVDEAHTFSPEWFRCCVAALKGGEDGHLLIVSDGNQKIYKRKNFSWKSVGVRAQGRTQILKLNYRNTREILEAAWTIMSSGQVQDSWSDNEPTFPLISPRASNKKGPKPTLHLTQSLKHSIQIVLEQINRFKQHGYEYRDIAVIFHSRATPSQDWLPKLKKGLNSCFREVAKFKLSRVVSENAVPHQPTYANAF